MAATPERGEPALLDSVETHGVDRTEAPGADGAETPGPDRGEAPDAHRTQAPDARRTQAPAAGRTQAPDAGRTQAPDARRARAEAAEPHEESGKSARFSAGPAAPPRTLVDVFEDSVRAHPDEPALDDGTELLTYRALAVEVDRRRRALVAAGVGLGDRVGVRVPSGTNELYAAVLAVLAAGAAYVPVDAEDPDERADLVFGEAGVRAVLGAGGRIDVTAPADAPAPAAAPAVDARPGPGHDAWIIFTSGSTGKPKGVAVSHRSAAAFVDAEAALFLAEEPIGPGDRVMAGLSVAFDASCEEMWLAWRHGACLVPVPRSQVRSGADLGPWLVDQEITVVSTVPTLAALWEPEDLGEVRLLIFGGEACPPELTQRLVTEGREVWNTYGPTEATVVACASLLTGEEPIRIGLPLNGWELAVVDESGEPVPMGGSGQLVIGGVGLARYLDPAKDAEKYAPLESLGWERAYRSGDLVRAEPEGLVFLGRGDEQIKLGGRRIELGEVDAALQSLPGVAGAAAAVRTARGGNQLLVGYLVTQEGWDHAAAVTRLRAELPAALVPLLAPVDELPTRTSGKVDRDALPWPLPHLETTGPTEQLYGTEAWLAEQWSETLGVAVSGPADDFFAIGGSSLAAAQLTTRLRTRYPSAAVVDVYQQPTLRKLARRLEKSVQDDGAARTVAPVPLRSQVVQSLLLLPLYTLVGLRWTVALLALGNVLHTFGAYSWAPTASWWLVAAGAALLYSPPGRLAIAAGGARLLLRGVKAGRHPRGGSVHLRLWTAERLAECVRATSLTGSWLERYARALGAKVGPEVDLHSLPPVTGMLKLGRGCAVESEVDLSGHWLDGDRLVIGPVRVGAGAVVGTRGILFPGARVGKRAEVAPGSAVVGQVPTGQRWAGAPAGKLGKAKHNWPDRRPPRPLHWRAVYGATGFCLTSLPVLAALPALLVVSRFVPAGAGLGAALRGALLAVVPGALAFGLAYALLLLVSVRLLSLGLRTGSHPTHSRIGWQAWTVTQLMDLSRETLFPLYAGLITPVWLRLLGMKIGRGAEVSTVLALPSLTTVGEGAFLADDTLTAPYELGGGWMRIGHSEIGRRAFLGNSGMTAPGRSVPDGGLVGVLSATPKKAKKGSSYLGLPPVRLPRSAADSDQSRTYDPPARLLWARGLVELCRLVPVFCSAALAVLTAAALCALITAGPGIWATALLSGAVLLAAGFAACGVSVAAKWLLVGRHRAGEHPLWSGFVWRNELADTFVEVLAVPWLVGAVPGTPLLSLWLRGLGARIGRGVWCESYWLPETDLVVLGDAVSVNRGCVLQTHLFHDRILRTDTVVLREGATLGPGGIVLPGSTIGARSTLGPASLVMAGESVPADTRWLGNPIEAWRS
ncbi:Pls/PosA family non-ribosomal peptide synthetase [Streptomyces sp. H27-S2]|uniref:Pls/PosA family non-ribosomal peptide synthetase n=1 Tax=Streptomyces antarcticus TaxID=2996458 RepID=UPI0022711C4B|nr:Pls/PosA family non-ribosomal peptide synthetase [Streptomyces sp. H27-S2]MCY0950052.1 amino acid adenylation domain-containing protein [Streptomyces sp. H27-S2]